MKTLIAGHVTHDYYDGEIVAGGCAFYGARVHAEFNDRVRLVTAVGADFACQEAIADLDADIRREGQTTAFANYYPEDGPRRQLLEARGPVVEPGDVEKKWLDADLVHLAPVCGEIDLGEWISAVGDGLVAINVQGWLKHAGPVVDSSSFEEIQARGISGPAHRVVERPWEPSEEMLERVDVACLSDEDLAEQGDLIDRLVKSVPVVALTLGKRGSRLYVEGEKRDVGVVPADVVDPTGAGDVFAAAFSHHLAAGFEPMVAAEYAAAAASIGVEGRGPAALDGLDEMSSRRRCVEPQCDRR